MELLWLMDTYDPAVGRKYVDMQEEFMELDIEDAVDVYSLPVELLATFGGLGLFLARRLHQFCQDRLLYPLSFVEVTTRSGNNASEDVPLSHRLRASWDFEDQPITEDRLETILTWLADVETHEGIDEEGTLVSVRTGSDDGSLDNGGRATSHEV